MDLDSRDERDVDLIMACTCVRWMVIAFPSPLLVSMSDDLKPPSKEIVKSVSVKDQSTSKKKTKAATIVAATAGAGDVVEESNFEDRNKDRFVSLLHELSKVISVTRTIESSTSPHSLAHHTQLVISILNQKMFTTKLTEKHGNCDLLNAVTICQQMLLGLVRRYSMLIIKNPSSIASVWAILGLLSHLKNEKEKSLQNLNGYDDDEDEDKNILASILTEEELSDLVTSVGSALQTPSHWLRICLLKFLSYLPHPKLRAIQVRQQENENENENENGRSEEENDKKEEKNGIEMKSISNNNHNNVNDNKSDGKDKINSWSMREKQEEERSVDIALLCLETACTPAELKAEREFARRAGKLEVHVRSGRLPAPYVRLICSMCLGLLNVKFKPFWEPSIMILIAAARTKAGEAVLWPLLLDFIQKASKNTESAPRIFKNKNKVIVVDDQVKFSLIRWISRMSFLCIHFHQSMYVCMYLSIYLHLSMYLSIYVSIYLSIYLSMYLSIYLCIYLCMYLSIHLPIYLFIYLSMYVFIYPSTYLSIYLPICLSIYVPIHLSIYLSIYQSISLMMLL